MVKDKHWKGAVNIIVNTRKLEIRAKMFKRIKGFHHQSCFIQSVILNRAANLCIVDVVLLFLKTWQYENILLKTFTNERTIKQ